MLVIEVQLPHQEEMKKIEWHKDAPTFHELKERVQNCGIPGDWCVEVMRGDNFFSPDDNTEINGARITVRASPIAGRLSRILLDCCYLNASSSWVQDGKMNL